MTIRIRVIEPIGTDAYVAHTARQAARIVNPGTEVEVVSLKNAHCRHHLEYHAYEGLVTTDIVKVMRDTARQGFDAAVIACFYDPALREAREISGATVVTAPCQASLEAVASLANRFSIIVGRRKWIDRMGERVRNYGYGHRLASFRSLDMGVEEFQKDRAETARRMLEAGRKAIDEDGAEALILGCTIEYGFFRDLQDTLGVPVIDCSFAAIKRAEQLADLKQRFGWGPSRVGTCEAPPEEKELRAWNVFDDDNPPIGGRMWAAYSAAQPQVLPVLAVASQA